MSELESRGPPKVVCLWVFGIYRMENIRGLIDGMGTVGLHGANGHNGSIKDHVT